jgi:hypothetical protein
MLKINKPKKVIQSLAPLATDKLKAVTAGDGTGVVADRITLNHNATMVKARPRPTR